MLATLAVFALGRRCFGRRVGVWAALLFFTMPFTATLMIRAWVEFALTLYVAARRDRRCWRGARAARVQWLALGGRDGRVRGAARS